jgi:hypothetical protein
MVMFMGFDSEGESWRPGTTGARKPKRLHLRDIGIITAGIFKTDLLSQDLIEMTCTPRHKFCGGDVRYPQ